MAATSPALDFSASSLHSHSSAALTMGSSTPPGPCSHDNRARISPTPPHSARGARWQQGSHTDRDRASLPMQARCCFASQWIPKKLVRTNKESARLLVSSLRAAWFPWVCFGVASLCLMAQRGAVEEILVLGGLQVRAHLQQVALVPIQHTARKQSNRDRV